MLMALSIHCCILQLKYIQLPEECVWDSVLKIALPSTGLELVWARTVELLAHHPMQLILFLMSCLCQQVGLILQLFSSTQS